MAINTVALKAIVFEERKIFCRKETLTTIIVELKYFHHI